MIDESDKKMLTIAAATFLVGMLAVLAAVLACALAGLL